MEWKIEYQKDHGIVYVRLAGPGDHESWQKMAVECVAIAGEQNCNRFLVDERDATFESSISNIYSWSEDMDEGGITRANKVAFLYSDSPANRSDYRFFETVSRNRGYNIRIFDDQLKAVAWLIS